MEEWKRTGMPLRMALKYPPLGLSKSLQVQGRHTGKTLTRPKGVGLPPLGSRIRRRHKSLLVQGSLRKPDKVSCKVWKVWHIPHSHAHTPWGLACALWEQVLRWSRSTDTGQGLSPNLLTVRPQWASSSSSPQSPHTQNKNCVGHFGAVQQQSKMCFLEQSNHASVVVLPLPCGAPWLQTWSGPFSPCLQVLEWFRWDVSQIL